MCSNHELQATLNALGYLEDGEYFKSRDCLNAAKDLIRFLKRDDPNEKTVRRELLKSGIIRTDLIPLIKSLNSKKDAELFDIALRLLVNLTQSALNCFELKIPDSKITHNIFIEIESHLKNTKESFADAEFAKVLCEKLKEIISKNWEDRPEEEDLIVERILFLIRNILQIKPPDDEENRLTTDLNSHDLLVLNFHKTNLLDTLVEMIGSNNHLKYSMHLLEIITFILRDQSSEDLAKASETESNLDSKRSQLEKQRDINELSLLQMRDTQMRKHNKMRLNPRHSRFMGTYTALNMKSINDENNLIVHKRARTMDDLLDDSSKKRMKKAKNKIVYEDLMQRKKLEDDEICYYYWLIQFLTEFNRNSDIDEQTKIEQIKETFSMELFHSIEVFMQRCDEMMRVDKKLNRVWAKRMHTAMKCYKENLITLFAMEKKIKAFELANKNLNSNESNTQEKPIEKNKEINDELVDLDLSGDGPENEKLNQNADINKPVDAVQPKGLLNEKTMDLIEKLKDQIFYIQEFRELFIKILKDFDQGKMSKNFLRDIIEANHIFISMLETKMKNGALNIASKKKAKKIKIKMSKVKETKEEKEARLKEQKLYKKRTKQQEPDFKTTIWQKTFDKIASLMQSDAVLNVEEDNLMPFDFVATSDEEFDANKDKVIEKIQQLLIDGKQDDSIALFREARCLWPNDRELFGNPQIEADEEFEVYKNLFMRPISIKKPEKKKVAVAEKNEVENANKENECVDEEDKNEKTENDKDNDELFDEEVNKEEFGEEEQDNEDKKYVIEEESLDFEKFLFRYSNPKIIRCYILMLSEYSKNTDFLNRCCMNYFERMALDCHSPECLYQLSLFALINTIYKDPLSRFMMNIMDEDNTQRRAIDDIYASTYSSEDMFSFFRSILAQFFEKSVHNKFLFSDLLFFTDKNPAKEVDK